MNSSPRVFLLSPANTGGLRCAMLMRENAEFDLAVRLRDGIATIGEVYAFISGLYFRGKMEYVSVFASPPKGIPGAVVIVPGIGLVPPETLVSIEQLRAISRVPIHEDNGAYRIPLLRDAALLESHGGPGCQYVLLGSIATEKYTRPLLDLFGARLVFPEAFVGRGDMSRGGLMLRCARTAVELTYVPVQGAVRHGARPPKLERWREAVIFVGVQGAGKTTYFAEHFAATHVHVSRDVQGTAMREAALIDGCLRDGRSFVIDDTNTTRASRAAFCWAGEGGGIPGDRISFRHSGGGRRSVAIITGKTRSRFRCRRSCDRRRCWRNRSCGGVRRGPRCSAT